MRFVSLVIVLSCLWMLLSGHTEPLLLGMGAASIALITWLASRMRVVDEEGLPVDVSHRAFPYSLWLLVEIVKSNVALMKVVVAKDMPIQPQIVRVPTGTRSDLGRVVYANSVTMTPGTVTLEADDDELVVHALTDEAAQGLRSGDMQRRAVRVAGNERGGAA
jgi:multicomponent Na+:H+ antiporter subunit E